jgi:glycosyltransferase involved in cell wall biosynthesis
MACKLPLILYNVPGLKDFISNDDNGFLIKSNHKELAAKIIEYKNNPDLIKTKGEKGYQFCRDNFYMRDNVLKIINLYKSIK